MKKLALIVFAAMAFNASALAFTTIQRIGDSDIYTMYDTTSGSLRSCLQTGDMVTCQ